jgi:hypothetical protein
VPGVRITNRTQNSPSHSTGTQVTVLDPLFSAVRRRARRARRAYMYGAGQQVLQEKALLAPPVGQFEGCADPVRARIHKTQCANAAAAATRQHCGVATLSQTRPGPTYHPAAQTRAYSPISVPAACDAPQRRPPGSRSHSRCPSGQGAVRPDGCHPSTSPDRRREPASQPARRSRSLSRVRTRALPWALPPTPKPKAHRMSSSQVGRQVAREAQLSVTLHPMQLSDSPCCGMPR